MWEVIVVDLQSRKSKPERVELRTLQLINEIRPEVTQTGTSPHWSVDQFANYLSRAARRGEGGVHGFRMRRRTHSEGCVEHLWSGVRDLVAKLKTFVMRLRGVFA
jgi:hypothetical protein